MKLFSLFFRFCFAFIIILISSLMMPAEVQWNESSVSSLMMSTEVLQWNFFSVSSSYNLIFIMNDFCQILVSSRLPNFSTHTITMEAVESMLIKESVR